MMKKWIALLLCLMMALSLVACGGGNDTAADDDVPADDQQQAADDTQSDSTNPLDVMEFIEVPDGLVGTSWEFCGGFVDGAELDSAQATEMLKANGGKLQLNIIGEDTAEYISGDTVMSGPCGVTENNDAIVLTLDNDDGTTADNVFQFTELNGEIIMVAIEGNSGLYFRQIVEG